MKRTQEPKKPTRRQKIAISAAGLDWTSWLVSKEAHDEMHLVSRRSGRRRIVKK